MKKLLETLERDARARVASMAGLTLIVELALIRWMASNVFHLGFFTNFILLGCFLGIGLGFLCARRPWDLFKVSPLPLFAVMALTTLGRVELPVPRAGDVVFHGISVENTSWIPVPVLLALLFVGIVTTFTCLSQGTARSFRELPSLQAYTWDILGSLSGVALFTVMSAAWTPSWVWFLVAALLWAALLLTHDARDKIKPAMLALGSLVVLGANPDTMLHATEVVWSPYQMLTAFDDVEAEGTMHIMANRLPHQTIFPIEADDPVRSRPFEIAARHGLTTIDKALVVGAGSGVDVDMMLKRGVGSILAAELDPGIAALAREHNRAQPYADPRVELVVDDGRHVIESSADRFDYVLYALPDSLALLSSHSNVRLESFLFTQESFQAVKEHLTDDGVFVLYNHYISPQVIGRIGANLEAVWGHPPHVEILDGKDFAVFVIGANVRGERFEGAAPENLTDLPTDDWPYLHMMSKQLPMLYVVPILLLLLLSGLAVWWLSPPGEEVGKERWPLFFMGAAFMMLETKSIILFSLLFGATWLVNSMVFGAVLLMVLAANTMVARRPPRHLWTWYVGLGAMLAAVYFLPTRALLGIEQPVTRYVVASLVVFLPIFLANVIFARVFSSSKSSELAFGWNLLGTMLGGALEYLSLAMGYRFLTIIVAGFYFLAFATTYLIQGDAPGEPDDSGEPDGASGEAEPEPDAV